VDKIVRDLLIKLTYEHKFNTVSQQIHSANDIDDILLKLKDHILELLDADRITIYAVSDLNPAKLYSKVKTGGDIKEIHVLLNKKSIAGYAGSTLKLVNVKNAYDSLELTKIDPELKFDSSWDRMTGYTTKQVLAMPILFESDLAGVIQVINKKNGGMFTEEDEYAIQEISNVLAIAFYNKTRMLERQSKFSYLLLNNYISRKELAKAVAISRKLKTDVETTLMERFKVPKHLILKALSRFYKCEVYDFNRSDIDPTLIKGLSHGYLKKHLCIPIKKQGDTVVIVTIDPSDVGRLQEVMVSVGAQSNEIRVASKEDIVKTLQHLLEPESKKKLSTAKDIVGELDRESMEEKEEDEDALAIEESDSKVVQLVNKIIYDAYKQGVSDIHIEPYGKQMEADIRFRVDGKCDRYLKVPSSHISAIISRIKILSGLDISEKRKPQDGRIKFKVSDNKKIELRVATIPTVGRNEDVVMRILPSGGALPIDKMGLSDRNLRELKEMSKKPYGIILVVGPTGSGKTTTLHATLGYINSPDKKIWTAEDPVEVSQYGLRQVQVLPKIGYTFATAMRAFLRADPDVIMVGEMRDVETTATGIEASLTGHLVFSTLHTNSAPEAVVRLLDMGMDPYNFSDALLGILAQRLVRRLCNDCKETFRPSRQEFDELKRLYGDMFDERVKVNHQTLSLYRTKGCESCRNTGYKGRMGIHELLVGSDTIKKLIQKKDAVEKIGRASCRERV